VIGIRLWVSASWAHDDDDDDDDGDDGHLSQV